MGYVHMMASEYLILALHMEKCYEPHAKTLGCDIKQNKLWRMTYVYANVDM